MADSNINIKINAIDNASRNIKATNDQLIFLGKTATKASTGVGNIDKAAKKARITFKDVKGALTDLNQGLELLKKVARGVQQAFEFAKEGAEIAQTKESFDRLTSTLESNVDLLEQLKITSGGTVDEMTLMSSALLLAAGAGEELEKSLLQAMPELMEIAKAANKLNPALGDTAFMFDSIARGIKRQSPLILDNLGLMIKVGDANEEYAAELGKTVEELTATEKQMALLNGTMKAGEILIKQAGGAAGGAVDPFNEFSASLKDNTDSLKENAKDGVLPLIESLNELNRIRQHEAGIRKTLERAEEAGLITRNESNGIYEESTSIINGVAWSEERLTEVTKELAIYEAKSAAEAKRNGAAHVQALEQMAIARGDYTEITRLSIAEEIKLEDAATKAIIKAREVQNKATTAFNQNRLSQMEDINSIEMQFNNDLIEAKEELADVEKEISDAVSAGYSTRSRKVQELITKQDELKGKVTEVEEAHITANKEILWGFLQQKLGADGLLTDDETKWLAEKREEWGLWGKDISTLLDDSLDEVNAWADEINGLKTTLTVDYVLRGTSLVIPDDPATGGGGIIPDIVGGSIGGIEQKATGTRGQWQTVPSGYDHDNYLVGLMSGEKYQVKSRGEVSSSTGNNVTINIMESHTPRATGDAVVSALKVQGVFAS